MDATSPQPVAHVDQRIAALADKVRRDWLPPIDPADCAHQLDTPVTYRELPATLWGLHTEWGEVVINSTLSRRRQRFALAHELGHVVAARGDVPWAGRNEERFADRFGRELLAPVRLLVGEAVSVELMCERFNVEDRVILSQLVMAGVKSAFISSKDGAVICGSCGDVQRHVGCGCARYRAPHQSAGAASA